MHAEAFLDAMLFVQELRRLTCALVCYVCVRQFGYIAKAIGPHDVLATLLNNLKVQERQNRVCTTVAIAIVAETWSVTQHTCTTR